MMENQKEGFTYNYSAGEQEELRKIRQKYEPQKEDMMEKLRRMDAGVTQKATMYSILVGVIGALILGTGMSLIMTEFGEVLGLSQMAEMAAGILIGIAGLVLVSLAYPLYNHVLKKEREKIAPEILKLAEELMK